MLVYRTRFKGYSVPGRWTMPLCPQVNNNHCYVTVPSAGKGTCGTAGPRDRGSAGAGLKDHGRGSEESQNVRS